MTIGSLRKRCEMVVAAKGVLVFPIESPCLRCSLPPFTNFSNRLYLVIPFLLVPVRVLLAFSFLERRANAARRGTAFTPNPDNLRQIYVNTFPNF